MKKKLDLELKNLNVVIASHVFASGPALELEEYLKNKVKSLLFIGHPFLDRKDISSFYRSYTKWTVIEHKAFGWKLPDPIMRIKDAFYTLIWVLFRNEKTNLFIGSDNFLAFLGLVLKKLGKVDEVILYTIDYVSVRFKNPVMNYIYHFFDKYCLKNCKVVWNVSERMAEGREETDGMKKEECVPQIVVPLGIWYDRIPKFTFKERDKHTIVFMGHILEKQGIDVVIRALPLILKKDSKVKFLVIGTGPYENALKKLVKELKLQEKVEFTGYIERHEDVEEKLAKSTLAVATYRPDPDSFTYFADPGKIKNYLAAGLPVFVTNVPLIAKVLEKKKCGVIPEYNESDVADKVTKMLMNKSVLEEYSTNALKFAKQFDWNIVFAKAFLESI